MENPDEFVNRSQGWVGVTKLNRKNDEMPDVVEPGSRVFLTKEEQELTARAHRRREDSPFHPREITHYDPLTQEPVAKFVAPLLEKVEPEPAPEPAQEAARPRRRRAEPAAA